MSRETFLARTEEERFSQNFRRTVLMLFWSI